MQETVNHGFPRSFWISLVSFCASLVLMLICRVFIAFIAGRGPDGVEGGMVTLVLFGPPIAAVALGVISVYFGATGLRRTWLPLVWVIPSGILTASLLLGLIHDFQDPGDPVQAVKRSPAVAYCVSTNNGPSRYFVIQEVWKGRSDPRLSVSLGQRLSFPISPTANSNGLIALFSPTSSFGRGPLHASRCIFVYDGTVPAAHGMQLSEFRSKCGL